jgi:hypothetical protein
VDFDFSIPVEPPPEEVRNAVRFKMDELVPFTSEAEILNEFGLSGAPSISAVDEVPF